MMQRVKILALALTILSVIAATTLPLQVTVYFTGYSNIDVQNTYDSLSHINETTGTFCESCRANYTAAYNDICNQGPPGTSCTFELDTVYEWNSTLMAYSQRTGYRLILHQPLKEAFTHYCLWWDKNFCWQAHQNDYCTWEADKACHWN